MQIYFNMLIYAMVEETYFSKWGLALQKRTSKTGLYQKVSFCHKILFELIELLPFMR